MKKLSDLSLEQLWELFPIILKPYTSKYQETYNQENITLNKILNHIDIKRISHIGSTAVVGIKSKPIVDILVEIEDVSNIKTIKRVLLNNGWTLMNETYTPFKVSFNKGYTIDGYADKVFHLHVKKYGDCDELYFRDYLNDHKDVRDTYEVLKKALLKKHSKNRDAYTKDKTEFVRNVTNQAKNFYKFKYNISLIT